MTALHHLRLNVSDLYRAREFYGTLLSWLGFEERQSSYSSAGDLERCRYYKEGLLLLIGQSSAKDRPYTQALGLHHIAFAVPSREAVDRFYQEVLLDLAGAEIEDPPVDCPEYRQGYYATFFYDPDGIKLEVTYAP